MISNNPDRYVGNQQETRKKIIHQRLMDDKTRLGALAESKVIAELIKTDFDVFIQFSGKSPVDLIAHKNGKLFKIQVKGTSSLTKYGSYRVLIASIRSNKTANRIVHFNSSICDVLAVYVEPLDKIFFFNALEITTRKQLNIKSDLQGHDDLSGILRDYMRDA